MSLGGGPGGDHQGLGDHPVVDPDIYIGGVHEQVGELGVLEWAGRNSPTASSMSLQILDTVDLETPESVPSARNRSSTLRVETPSIQAEQITARQGLVHPLA